MTSVPKPLKFLRNQYETLKTVYEKIHDKTTKVCTLNEAKFTHLAYNTELFVNICVYKKKEFCADIISVLGMTISDKRECLKYRFLSSKELVGSWGHEYARYTYMCENINNKATRLNFVKKIVNFKNKDRFELLYLFYGGIHSFKI